MKIGIVTIHHAPNYGAVMQAYALTQFLTRLGHDVELVDYRPKRAVDYYRQPLLKRMRPNFKLFARNYLFERFASTTLQQGTTRCASAAELAAACAKYAVLVAGSDQIWCTGQGSFRGYDSNFFLEFQVGDVRKVSYAASAGQTADFGVHTDSVALSLAQFQHLSVRDQHTRAMVEAVTGRSVDVVLDPTFLTDFQELLGEVEPSQDLVIFANRPGVFDEVARKVASEHKLRIVALGGKSRVADVHLQALSPLSWLRHLAASRAVMTDYFHGAALAANFGKPMLISAPGGKRLKIGDLLQRLSLTDSLLENANSLPALQAGLQDPARYAQHLATVLAPHQQQSKDFLERALA